MESMSAKSGTEVTIVENILTRNDYEFVSWNTKKDGSGTDYKDKDKIKLTGNMILYAKWAMTDDAINKKFSNGGLIKIEGDISSNFTKIADAAKNSNAKFSLDLSGTTGLTSIGVRKFYKCTNLTAFIIPASVKSIGDSAFLGCTSLTSITIPDSVTSIGDEVFEQCESLISIAIPNSVTFIGEEAFAISGLKTITIPDSVTSIGKKMFLRCTNLTSITIPPSVESIDSYAFASCTNLKSIIIPDGVTSICLYTFHGCTSLTSIVIPVSVKSIDRCAFLDCNNLTTVNYKEGSEEQWKTISIKDNNEPLKSATKNYNYKG